MNNNKNKLYSIIFPIWIMWIFPITWAIVLPANFIINLIVLLITMKCIKVPYIKENIKSIIVKVWFLGLLANIIGTIPMILPNILSSKLGTDNWLYKNIVTTISYNPFSNIYAFIWVTICILISGICIYNFNYNMVFKQLNIDHDKKKTLALSLAIFTSPYLFYLPTMLFA